MELTGHKILITGGSAGIGLALAEKFSELGNEIIITGRSQAKLDAAKQAHPEWWTIQCDAADPKAIAQLAATIERDHPTTDVLVNNAGVFQFRNLTTPTKDLDGLTKEIDINLSGPIRTVSALIGVITQNKGTIINVSSGLAYVPIQCAPIYCATKAAIHSYTISLRYQLQSAGVEVVELMPPAVKTEMTSELPEDGDFKLITTQELIDATMKGLRAGKTEIRPGQANQLQFMSRLAPGFINGQLAKGSASLVPPPE